MGCSEEVDTSRNVINAEFFIDEDKKNKKNRIINSAENIQNKESAKYKNEAQIKQCQIKIDDEIIPFSYDYEFKTTGKYIVKYTFPDPLTEACFCSIVANQ